MVHLVVVGAVSERVFSAVSCVSNPNAQVVAAKIQTTLCNDFKFHNRWSPTRLDHLATANTNTVSITIKATAEEIKFNRNRLLFLMKELFEVVYMD